ncbi:MAG: hypothetical protein PVI21_05715 [Candidatus Woesebacteria bacterium]|jgi:ribulose-phosphate 3-epimerase
MPIICPTITASDPHGYREQVAKVEDFSKRLHIDLADGSLAPAKLMNIAQIYWPEGSIADLHLMYKKPRSYIETAISLKPNMIVLQVESEGDMLGLVLELQSMGIKAGVALLPETELQKHENLISTADHVLLFAGKLGYQGGKADMNVLKKIPDISAINPTAELGWDGGINAENLPLLLSQGVEVFNVGGALQNADFPADVYKELNGLLK